MNLVENILDQMNERGSICKQNGLNTFGNQV